ncbi:GntR family transcriptional regulator [Fulvimarina endophytica]|uniref:GntR family transcriptional regulator n=1 Tax=Fulvimarina endophytica TaxID=2293836 RepID=A0A371WZ43_9HYPH|nr:GntR family transcriptional regulator [Fulvimarina endophytica]RFC62219.1 GntR family transcriptional regulator [Fulvimarina endophytica]
MATTIKEADLGIRVDRPTKTLRELTLEKMREAILTSHFKPGERLVERDLCAQLGVSRTIVREVLRHLESEGLVASLPNRGPIVAETTAEDAWQIYSIRAALESMAAEACAELAPEDAIEDMGEALLAIEKAYEAKSPPAVLEATKTFYEIMFHAAGQAMAWSIVSSLMLRINRLRSLTIADRARDKDGPREMRAILDAIASRDPAKAGLAARHHVEQASSIARRIIAPPRQS